tara:strand:+ start:195 stop:701 length:507 start_codon:yes stop_codon:yes gene_type:complete
MVVPAADDTSYPQGTNVFSNPNDFDPYDCPLEVLYSHPYGDCPSDIIPDYLVPGSVSVYGGGVGAADVNIGILSHKCGHPVPGEPPQCPPPIVWREQENFTRSWSDPESWDNQTAPLEVGKILSCYSSIAIPTHVKILICVSLFYRATLSLSNQSGKWCLTAKTSMIS